MFLLQSLNDFVRFRIVLISENVVVSLASRLEVLVV